MICISRKRVLEELVVVAAENSRHALARALHQAAAEFPSVHVSFSDTREPHLHARDWRRADFDLWTFDCSVDALAAEPFILSVAATTGDEDVPLEVLNRCQRHVRRRNRHSQNATFSRVLRAHAALHDLDKPLVRADYNHALDVWQWTLRLDGDASCAVQTAALFHDVERLVSEADARVEHLAADYQQFKDAHARAGAVMADRVLAEAGVDASLRNEVAELIASHERRDGGPGVATLNDADALSFFCLNSPGYLDYFGPEQTRQKLAYTWNRMGAAARTRMRGIRLRPDVRALMEEVCE